MFHFAPVAYYAITTSITRCLKFRRLRPYGVGYGLVVSQFSSYRHGFDTVVGVVTWSPWSGFRRHWFK